MERIRDQQESRPKRPAGPGLCSGEGMVVIETCYADDRHCPNRLIPVSAWKDAIEAWVKRREIGRRLREKLAGRKVLFHHKLRVAISACPNGCSRPQIADFGLMGYTRPSVDPAECRICGACADVCPDQAIIVENAPPIFDRQACQGCTKCHDICPVNCISLDEPGVRVMAGGKLGRKPRFAEKIAEVQTSTEAVAHIERLVEQYLAGSRAGERFGEWWARRKEEGK